MIVEGWRDNDGYRVRFEDVTADLSVEIFRALILYLQNVRDLRPGQYCKAEFDVPEWEDDADPHAEDPIV